MNDLPRYTWDQATILHVWSADAFAAVGINPATVRKWASRDQIQPVAVGPRGCKLYDYQQVVRHAERNTSSSLELQPGIVSQYGTGG